MGVWGMFCRFGQILLANHKTSTINMKTFITLLIIACFIFFHSCKKEEYNHNVFDEIPTVSIQLLYHNPYDKKCSIGLPVEMEPKTEHPYFHQLSEKYNFKYLWDFGDGTQSTEENVTHIYDKTGEYSIKLTLYLNNDSMQIETQADVTIFPRIIEETSPAENGKYICELNDGGYSIIYTSNEEGTPAHLYLSNYDGNSIVSNKKKIGRDYYFFGGITHNQLGNLVILDDSWFKEYTCSGTLINSNYGVGIYSSIKSYNNGYLLVGSDEQKIKIKELNSIGETIHSNVYDLRIDGFTRNGISQTDDNEIFVHYIDKSTQIDNNRKTILRRIRVDSSTVWEKEYDLKATNNIYKLSDGYILTGIFVDGYLGRIEQAFIKIDNKGDVIWRYSTPVNSDYNSGNSPGTNFFDNNNSLIIFFDNMRCIEIDNEGQLISEMYFGRSLDLFNYAIKNDKGNYVILGSRPFDYEDMDAMDISDLIFIEIDKNLNPIE